MLDLLNEHIGLQEGQTVVVDRGMAYSQNLEELKRRGLNYIVASRQSERDKWLADYDDSGELRIRQDLVPEKQHEELYKLLEVPARILKPVKTWRTNGESRRD